MAFRTSSTHPSVGDNENLTVNLDSRYHHPVDDGSIKPASGPSTKDGSTSALQQKHNRAKQKRRRVIRACDECRRKKIKCSSEQPCTHCTDYSYECTYDRPSSRRRNPTPQFIEALESRLRKAETLLRVFLPNLDLDNPQLDDHSVKQLLVMGEERKGGISQPSFMSHPEPAVVNGDESLVESSNGLNPYGQGHWVNHGPSSERLHGQMENSIVPGFKPEPGSAEASALAFYLEYVNQRSRYFHVQSPLSCICSSRYETVQDPGPDSILNQNFIWQAFEFPPQVSSHDQQSKPPISSMSDSRKLRMEVNNFDSMRDFDMGENLHLFGNLDFSRTAGADGRTQWPNDSVLTCKIPQ